MESGLTGLQVCEGFTGHERHSPVSNAFRYPVLYIRFDSSLAASISPILNKALKFFSFDPAEYLFKKSKNIDQEVRALIRDRFDYKAETIHLMTIPRLFGYAFNPVSFWFCRKEGRLDAVLCEVNNTFGERHFYWVRVKAQGEWAQAEKCFHVSPFLPVEGFYKFRFLDEEDRTRVDINYFSPAGGKVLTTWLDVKHRAVEQVSPFPLLRRYGWITALVIARIHYQALKLFFKRVRYYRKPERSKVEVSQ